MTEQIPCFQPAPEHTPGPWQFVTQADWPHKQTVHITAKGFGAVAVVNIDPSLPLRLVEQERANLRLIAAAPDMLKLLQDILAADDLAIAELMQMGMAPDMEDDACRLTERARALIAKATGAAA